MYLYSNNILYLSYTGLLEPLGQSQILNYLQLLSKDYGQNISLITFEKPEGERLDDELASRRTALDETVRELGEQDDFLGLYRDLERSLEVVDDAPPDDEEEEA